MFYVTENRVITDKEHVPSDESDSELSDDDDGSYFSTYSLFLFLSGATGTGTLIFLFLNFIIKNFSF